VYDPAAGTWTELQTGGTAPSIRLGESAFHDPAGGALVVFGETGERDCSADAQACRIGP